MKDEIKIQKSNPPTTLLALAFISLIAIAAVLLALYAFEQKNEADVQTQIAKERILQALQQQKIALEQRNIADSNKELAMEQRELSIESEKRAIEQKTIADTEVRKAKESKLMALQQQYLAEEQRANAEKQKSIAALNAEEAKRQQALAEKENSVAIEQKKIAGKLKGLSDSRGLAKESVLLLNENRFDSSKKKALEAWQLNNTNNGPTQNSDIYNALIANWTQSIGDKNQSGLHHSPVHCITGTPGNNTIITSDETGVLNEWILVNNALQRTASYSIKEDVRAMAVSPAGNRLVVLTGSGNGFVFTISSSEIKPLSNFKFTGSGKEVVFNTTEDIIVLSNKGIGKYSLSKSNVTPVAFINYTGIAGFATDKTGRFYIARGSQVNICNKWDDIPYDSLAVIYQFESKVTSIAVDDHQRYLATGTYNGMVWILDLKTNAVICNKALHLSSVNAVRFAIFNNDIVQLASAGADQTIKLIDVNAILQKNYNQDIITLKGHTKWIYSLYYTPDSRWLFSAGEDNKVIAWKTTMDDLYQTLSKK